jgi:TRAP-type mannitol/chloroaromatic compound transport system permease small subunit
MLYGALFMLGAHYTLLKGAHIRTDMLWEKFSPRKKGLIDAIAYIFFFFPAMALLFYASVDEAWHSFKMWELSEQTAWRPVLWPFKTVVPLTALLLMIQGISELLKSLYAARTGEFLTKAETIQV